MASTHRELPDARRGVLRTPQDREASSPPLVVLGAGAVVVGLAGRHEVGTDLKREQIVGTPDMKPSLIVAKVKAAGMNNVTLPTCDVAGTPITTGGRAKCFASYMRIHALEATGGKTYAQMPQFV